MISVAVDENFDHHVLRALVRRVPGLDHRLVTSAGLGGAPDEAVLDWAAREDRVVLTHDVRTMTRFAYERVARGEHMPGVIEVRSQAAIREVVDDLVLLVTCVTADECRNRVLYVPMR